ncbi:hypothetical protein OMP38_07690 [Cohnella ginsengisoli]|uniref:Uncharacterized protein n=1 Tax=Cohnella ginsengisoli TaxID=425004 RepID=A0A9X4KET0_9BACL|nr:hypothetical protein [Cohnella ginsengisoli]MDG0790752.1 hypothetical protein [Cohnella ginsengisoli]
MSMVYMVGLVFIIMIAGLAGTLTVGWSKANRSENAGYGSGTGKKWTRLGLLYALCVVVVLAVFLALLKP